MDQIHSGIEVPAAPGLRAPGLDSVDEAFDAFCQLREHGESVDPEEFCRRYPACQSSLRRAVEALLLMEGNPSFLHQATAVHWPEPGERFLNWTLEEELGKGGFARVYRARQPALGNREVVLKLSPGGSGEAWTLGRLQHPHVVPILHTEEASGAGLSAVCLPYLGRATLCDLLDRLLASPELPSRAHVILEAIQRYGESSPLAPAPVLTEGSFVEGIVHLAIQMTEALVYLHEEGVAHRDLKPSNVLLTPAGNVVLLDFNLAHDHASGRRPLGGTPAYMAPEQLAALTQLEVAQPEATMEAAPDVFALGVVLFELLSARHPFGPLPLTLPEEERRALLRQRHRTGPPALCALNPQVSPALAAVVERCLQYDPAARYGTAAELLTALRACQVLPAPVQPPRARLWTGVATGVVILAVTAAAVGTFGMRAKPYDAGKKAFQAGDYDRAAEHFEKALKDDPKSSEIKLALGRTQQRRSELSSALKYLEDAYRDQPDARIQAAYAYCLAEAEQYEAATLVGQKACESGEALAGAWNNLGFCLLQQSKHDEALKCFNQALTLDPKLAVAYHNRALCDLRKSERDKTHTYVPLDGIADVQKAIDLGWQDPRLFHHGAYLCAVASLRGANTLDKGTTWLSKALAQGYPWDKVEKQTILAPLVKKLSAEEVDAARKRPCRDLPKTILADPLPDA